MFWILWHRKIIMPKILYLLFTKNCDVKGKLSISKFGLAFKQEELKSFVRVCGNAQIHS